MCVGKEEGDVFTEWWREYVWCCGDWYGVDGDEEQVNPDACSSSLFLSPFLSSLSAVVSIIIIICHRHYIAVRVLVKVSQGVPSGSGGGGR